MLFTSGSGTIKARKEFIFAGPSRSAAVEYEALRPTRFERKGPKSHKTINEEMIICHYRGRDGVDVAASPIDLKSIPFESVRTFHNLEAYPYAFEADYDVLQWLTAMAGESPSARFLMKEAMQDSWFIGLDDLQGAGYAIDEQNCIVIIDHYGFTAGSLGRSSHFRHAVLTNFIRALRDLWHLRQNNNFEETFRPDAVLMLERARMADLETMVILCGWELRAAGHGEIWRYILGSEQGDMAMIFTRAMEKDPAGLYDGSVFARTFCQWYGEESRVAAGDSSTLEEMDDYLADGGKFGPQALSAEAIENLSTLPGSHAYLKGMGSNIIGDPYFVALHDTINESHLFQIVYDSKVTMAGGVPFRDSRLARKIFPGTLVPVRE
jgi:hypothetical protein